MNNGRESPHEVDSAVPSIPIRLFRVAVYIFAIIGFVLVVGYLAMKFGLTNMKGVIDTQRQSFLSPNVATPTPVWTEGQEWKVLKQAIINDSLTLTKAAQDADIDPRLLVSILIPEQLRLFHSERELFKQVFAPLQILVNQNQFSWGIMGIKQETAKQIETNLKDATSPFYLGPKYQNLLDFPTSNPESRGTERFSRITDEKNHYYGYLYAGLYLKQIMQQWKKGGQDISDQPAILATLYNIGFAHSQPHANPLSGGAEIDLGTTTKSFGALAEEFYFSGELTNYFPKSLAMSL